MLNTFPELLAYSTLAPFVLRVLLGLIFLDTAFLKFGKERGEWYRRFEAFGMPRIGVTIYALIQLAVAIMLILGIYTQIAAIIAAVFSGIGLYTEFKDAAILKRDIIFYIIIFLISLSLILTGAGAFAFDIPL